MTFRYIQYIYIFPNPLAPKVCCMVFPLYIPGFLKEVQENHWQDNKNHLDPTEVPLCVMELDVSQL